MNKKLMVCAALALLFGASTQATATVYTIYVQNAGDVVNYKYTSYWGNGSWSEAGANPNTVFHSYEPGNGNNASTSLSFDLTSFGVPAGDIASASFNFDILNIWTEGREAVANFSGGGTVNYSEGIGLKSFDITDSFITSIGTGASTANFSLAYTGYSGFTFGSADGGDPAYLRITTAENDPVSIPEPGSLILVGAGLIALVGAKKKKLI